MARRLRRTNHQPGLSCGARPEMANCGFVKLGWAVSIGCCLLACVRTPLDEPKESPEPEGGAGQGGVEESAGAVGLSGSTSDAGGLGRGGASLRGGAPGSGGFSQGGALGAGGRPGLGGAVGRGGMLGYGGGDPPAVDYDEPPVVDPDEPPAVDPDEPPAMDNDDPPPGDNEEPVPVDPDEPLPDADLPDGGVVELRRWRQLDTEGPSPRWGHGMAYDRLQRRTILQGGWPPNQETWSLDGEQWTQLETNQEPVAWIGFGMAFDSKRGVITKHGGYLNADSDACGTGLASSATFTLSDGDWTLASCEGPAAFWTQMVDDVDNQRMLLVSDSMTWEFDGTNWAILSENGPTGLPQRPALAYDLARQRAVLVSLDATWEFDGAAWTKVASSMPELGLAPSMAYDEERQRTVLFAVNQTFEWDGQNWEFVDIPGPSPRQEARMVYDADRGHIVLFGGDVPDAPLHEPLGDTWVYELTQTP